MRIMNLSLFPPQKILFSLLIQNLRVQLMGPSLFYLVEEKKKGLIRIEILQKKMTFEFSTPQFRKDKLLL